MLPEICFSGQEFTASRISRLAKEGKVKKIAAAIYTSNFDETEEQIVHRNILKIINHMFPGGVISHRTALQGGFPKENIYFITYKYRRTVQLPGITVCLLNGPGPLEGDTPFLTNLHISSTARCLLENLEVSRKRKTLPKSAPRTMVEEYLEKVLQLQGEKKLNQIRDHARIISSKLKSKKEFQILEQLTRAILGTGRAKDLKSKQGMARTMGKPYDGERVDLFFRLFSYLKSEVLPIKEEQGVHDSKLLTFFEAYFSNYIEGTRFEVTEASDMVFHNIIPEARPADAHDIIGTYSIVSSDHEMKRTPGSFEELKELLCSRHTTLMVGRPELTPGLFKTLNNRAGETRFVDTKLVEGTLNEGFQLINSLDQGLPRAIFMMFLISEVHPFNDGNGRVARIMMNSELIKAKQMRIIIPTSYRDDYILALRALSRAGRIEPLVKTLIKTQEITSEIDFSSIETARKQLSKINAFEEKL